MSFNKNLPEPAVALASTLQASYMFSHADCPCLFSVNMSSYIYIWFQLAVIRVPGVVRPCSRRPRLANSKYQIYIYFTRHLLVPQFVAVWRKGPVGERLKQSGSDGACYPAQHPPTQSLCIMVFWIWVGATGPPPPGGVGPMGPWAPWAPWAP